MNQKGAHTRGICLPSSSSRGHTASHFHFVCRLSFIPPRPSLTSIRLYEQKEKIKNKHATTGRPPVSRKHLPRLLSLLLQETTYTPSTEEGEEIGKAGETTRPDSYHLMDRPPVFTLSNLTKVQTHWPHQPNMVGVTYMMGMRRVGTPA